VRGSLELAARIVFVDDAVTDVRPVEARDEADAPIQAQASMISCACGVGGRREGNARHRGKRSCRIVSWRYSGRKSCPHCETQCASSIANNASGTRSSKIEAALGQQPFGGDVEQLQRAGRSVRRPRAGLRRPGSS
jgi:hypothetical protein